MQDEQSAGVVNEEVLIVTKGGVRRDGCVSDAIALRFHVFERGNMRAVEVARGTLDQQETIFKGETDTIKWGKGGEGRAGRKLNSDHTTGVEKRKDTKVKGRYGWVPEDGDGGAVGEVVGRFENSAVGV